MHPIFATHNVRVSSPRTEQIWSPKLVILNIQPEEVSQTSNYHLLGFK